MDPIRIESLSRGEGVGRLATGKTIFVPDAAPGDLVEVAIVEERHSHARGRVVRLLSAGSARVAPTCPLAGTCGGCQLQHVGLHAQREAKERAFYEALARVGGIERSSIAEARPLIPSPQERHYRIRARFSVDEGRLGFRSRGSRALTDVEACELLVPTLQALYGAVRAQLPETLLRRLAHLDLLVAPDGGGSLAFVPSDEAAPSEPFVKAGRALLASISLLRGVVVPGAPVLGEPELALPAAHVDARLYGRADAFVQANAAANETLVANVLEAAAPIASAGRVLELHAGGGNFTFALAQMGARVVAVESAPGSSRLARRAAAGAPTLRPLVRLIEGDAEKTARSFAAAGERFDLVLLDPPRTGAFALMSALVALLPRRIVYVSCDPATLARDLAPLLAGGYAVAQATPIDLFPQTFHVEGLVVLDRS